MGQRRSAGRGGIRSPGSFWLWVACPILGLLAMGAVALTLSWQEYREHHRGAERVEVYALAVAVTARLTDERAPLIDLLAGVRRPAGLSAEGRARTRADSDRAIARLEAAMARQGFAEVRTLGQARAILAATRREVDALAALPPPARDRAAVRGAVARLSGVLVHATAATEAVHGAQPGDLAMAMDDVATADLAARVREHGDRLRAEANTGQPAGAAADGRARLVQYLRGIEARIDPAVDDPRVTAAWRRLEAAATAAGLGPDSTAVAPTPATDDLGDILAAAAPLHDVSLEVGAARAEHRRGEARSWLVAIAAFVVAALLATGIAVVVVRRRVVTPLLLARRQIMALADDELPAPVGAPRGGPAVAALFDAVEALRRSQERRFALERERAALSDQLKVQAETDALTGLLNRHALQLVARDVVAGGLGEPGVGGDHVRPRPLQGDQRPPRPPGGRRGAARGRGPPARAVPRA